MSNVAQFGSFGDQSGSGLMFRNRVINGNFDIWQRGTSQTSVNLYGSDDRWSNDFSGSTRTHSQQAFTLGQTDVPNNPKYYSRTVVTSVANTGHSVLKRHRIEGVLTFSGQTTTLSFWSKADAAKNIAVEFVQNFGTGGSPSTRITNIGTTTIALTTTWRKYTVTVNLPSIASQTLGTDANSDFLEVNFWFDAGSGFNARTNSLGQQSGTFDIAQVQLEAGPVATPFEQRPIGLELALCQRYYQRGFQSLQSPAYASNAVSFRIPLMVPLRVAASPNQIVGTSTTNCVEKIGVTNITPTLTFGYISSGRAIQIDATLAGGFTPYQPCALAADIFEVSAEL
jgi:hypothetical protein